MGFRQTNSDYVILHMDEQISEQTGIALHTSRYKQGQNVFISL